LVPRMRHGELLAVGYYGGRLFTTCYGITGDSDQSIVLVLHHANFLTCQHYVQLQQSLWNDYQQPSCCVERAGFGFSPTPDIVPTKLELAGETKEIIQAMEQAVDSRRWIHLGHGSGAMYAWQAMTFGRSAGVGLILMDGFVPQSYACPDLRAFHVRRHTELQHWTHEWTQRLGFVRWKEMATNYTGLRLPTGPPIAVETAKQLMLTDRVHFAMNNAFLATPHLAAQLQPVQSQLRAVFVKSDASKARVAGIPGHTCAVEAGVQTLNKFFQRSEVMTSKGNYFDLAEDVESVKAAVRYVLDK